MKNYVLIASGLFLAIGSPGCKKKSTPCVLGTLLGSTCAGGYLIQVDTTSQHTIGQNVAFQGDAGSPLPGPAAKARVYSNVIMTYSALPPDMPRGQKFYFQYQPDKDKSSRICTANVSWYQAPVYTLLGTSTASCAALLPE